MITYCYLTIGFCLRGPIDPLRFSIVEYFWANSSITLRQTWDCRESLLLCLGSCAGKGNILFIASAVTRPLVVYGIPTAVAAGVLGLVKFYWLYNGFCMLLGDMGDKALTGTA